MELTLSPQSTNRRPNTFIYRWQSWFINLPLVYSSTKVAVIIEPFFETPLHLLSFKGAHLTGHEIIILSKENKCLNEYCKMRTMTNEF